MGTNRMIWALLLVVAFGFGGALVAASGTWNGAGNDNWTTGGTDGDDDWTGGSHPGFGAAETATFDVTSTDTATVSVAPANAVTLVMNGANATIDIANGVTLALTDITLSSAHTLAFNNTAGGGATVTLAGLTIPGAAANITIGANVTLQINGAANFTGLGTLTNSGTIVINSSGAAIAITGSAELAGAVTLTSAAGNNITLDASLTGTTLTCNGTGGTASVATGTTLSGALTKSGAGILTLTGAADIAGNITVSAGDFNAGAGSTFAGATINFTGAGNVTVDNVTFDGGVAQAVTVDAADDFSGTVDVDDGTDVTLTGALTLANTLTVGAGTDGSLSISGAFDAAANDVNVDAGAVLTLNNNADFAGNTGFNNGTIEFDATNAAIDVDASNTLDGDIDVITTAANDVTFVDGITLGGTLSITGAGQLLFEAAYDGFGEDLNVGTGSTAAFLAAATFGAAGTVTNDGTIGFNSAAGAIAVTNSAELNGDLMATSATGNNITFDASLSGDAFTCDGTGGSVIVTTTTTLTGTLTKSGAGVLTLTTAANLDGNIAMTAGDLTAGDGSAFSGATISFATTGNVTIGDVTFDRAGAQAVTLDAVDDLAGTINVSNGATVTVTVTGSFTLADTLTVGSGASGALTVGAVDMGSVAITVNAGATLTFTSSADFTGNTLTNNGTIVFSGAASTVTSDTEDLGDISVTAAGTVTFADATVVADINIANAATAMFGSQTVDIDGDLTCNTSGVFDQSATPGDVTFTDDGVITGTAVTIEGDVTVDAGTTRTVGDDGVAITNVTFAGTVVVDGTFVMYGDLTAGDETQTVTFQDDVTVALTGLFSVGEGTHDFEADVDLSAAADLITGGDTGDETVITFTGTAQALSFHAGGSIFGIDSVGANTAITQTGLMQLVGDLDLSGSSATTVWSGAGGTLQLGVATFGGNSDSGATDPDVITTDDGDVTFGAVTVPEVTDPGNIADDAFNAFTITTVAGGTGVYTIASLAIEGDTVDDDVATDETNAPQVTFTDSTITFSGAVTVNDGAQIGAGDDNNGGALTFDDCTVTFNGDVTIGSGTGADVLSGASLTGTATTSSTWTFDDATTLLVDAFADLNLTNITTTCANTDDYTIDASAADEVILQGCTIGGGTKAAGALTITLGGTDLNANNCIFQRYVAAGVQIADGTMLNLMNGCTFQNGQASGSHLSFLGDCNSGAGVVDCILNVFDNSTTGGTVSADDGELVMTANAGADDIEINFQGSSFGSGFTVTAANGETDDNDAAVAGSDVTWETIDTLAVAKAAASPTTVFANTATGTSTKTTFFLFTLTAAGSAASVVDDLTITIDDSGLTAGSITTGANSLVLFNDADSDGAFDTGEDIDMDDAANIAANVLTFAGIAESIAVGTPETWGIAFLTSATAVGTIDVYIDFNDVVLSSSGVVGGLPTTSPNDVTVSTAAADIDFTSVASVNGAATPVKASLDGNHVVLAIDVENTGSADATIDAVTLQLDVEYEDLTGTTFDPDTAFDGITAYVDGGAAGADNGDDSYTADGTDDEVLGTNTTNTLFATGAGTGVTVTVAPVSVTINFTTNDLVVEPGDTKTLYIVIEPTNTAADLTAARAQLMTMDLSLQTWTVTPLVSTTDANDVVNSPAADITSRQLSFVASGGGDDDEDDCSLRAGSSNRFGWLVLGLAALAVVAIRRRRVRA